MKKFLSLILITIITVSNCIIMSACGKPKSSPVEDFEYEFEDGTVTITGYIGSDLEIIIPDTIEERPVTTIGKEAFEGYDMTSIIIPKSVTRIENTFKDCNNLEKIEIPDTLKELSCSFEDTKWYDIQPNGVLYLNDMVVGYKGEKPDVITIDDGTKAILNGHFCKYRYEYRFRDTSVSGINAIHIPESVNYIAEKSVGYEHYYYDLSELTDKPSDSIIIYGKSGSVAETYANDNKIQFMEE